MPRTATALPRLRIAIAVLVGTILVVASALFVLYLADAVESGPRASTVDPRPWILLASLVAFNCLTYLVWLNRWNIVAHTALAFSVVAYGIPIVYLGQLNELSSAALDLYYQVMALGLLFAALGVFSGAALSRLTDASRIRFRTDFENPATQSTIRRRVLLLSALGVVGVFAAFAAMGFVPAFAADPLTAKFFRGAYAAAYQPVAPLYRGATSIISVLLPLLFLYALTLKSGRAAALAIASVFALLLGLIRDPAASGILLLLGIYVAVRRRPWLPYFGLLLATYFIGGALYYILTLFGVDSYGGVTAAQNDLLAQVAAGAPDIKDQINFLTAWLQRPEYTYGATWVGGLVPGNNPWNSSVWSLRVVNPTQEIAAIASGGLRLPPPIWGMVSFGWAGVAVVSFGTGAIQGYLAGIAKRLIPSTSLEVSAYWLVLYTACMDVFPNFFRFSYLTVLQLALLILVFCWRVGRSSLDGEQEGSRRRPPSRRKLAARVVAPPRGSEG